MATSVNKLWLGLAGSVIVLVLLGSRVYHLAVGEGPGDHEPQRINLRITEDGTLLLDDRPANPDSIIAECKRLAPVGGEIKVDNLATGEVAWRQSQLLIDKISETGVTYVVDIRCSAE